VREGTTWYRVFAKSDVEPDPEALRAALGADTIRREDVDRGWQRLEFGLHSGESLAVARFFRDEEGIRGELQAWAASLETLQNEPNQQMLMLHLATTQQVFTLQREGANDPLALRLCEALAWMTDGVYEIDNLGFFAHDGTLLVAEEV
jgi:hypothetical protein